MNIIKTIGSIGLATLVVSAFGQSNPPRFFELHQEPPVEVQRSFSLGQKSDSDLLHLTVSLPFGDPKGIQKYADAVSDQRILSIDISSPPKRLVEGSACPHIVSSEFASTLLRRE